MTNWFITILIAIAILFPINAPNYAANSRAAYQDEPLESYTTTASGLKYFDLVEGIGQTPRKGQRLIVHYVGYYTNGEQFDSSYDHDKPIEFILGSGQVIKGWEEGLSTMKPNGKRRLIIPPDLAYGEKGSKNGVPPNATLIFEIELVAVRTDRPKLER